jgi:hypothetical protein
MAAAGKRQPPFRCSLAFRAVEASAAILHSIYYSALRPAKGATRFPDKILKKMKKMDRLFHDVEKILLQK